MNTTITPTNVYVITIWQGPKLLDKFEQTMHPEHVKRRHQELVKRYGTTDVVILPKQGALS